MFRKFSILLLVFVLLAGCLTAVHALDDAGDSLNSTSDDQGMEDVSGVISPADEDLILKADDSQALNQSRIIVTNDNYMEYFNQSDGGKLSGAVENGSTLDFQGPIINHDQSLDVIFDVNRPVNIISSTGDAYIDLNTTAEGFFGENPGNRFIISNGGSWTNMSGIKFHNTQLWLFNTHHVVLDNISNVIEDQIIGSGVGATSIRANSTWITVRNSYFYSRNNGGSSSLVLAWADYCTLDNNTVIGEGDVGNLMYSTTYNVNIPEGVLANCHNSFTNNVIYGPAESVICYGICISGMDNLIENNTIHYSGHGIENQYEDASWPGGDAVLAQNRYIGNKLYDGCSMSISKYSIAYDNLVYGDFNAGIGSTVFNNTIYSDLKLTDGDAAIYNNFIGNLVIDGNCTLSSNVIANVSIEWDGYVFTENVVTHHITVLSRNVQILNSNLTGLLLDRTSSNVTVSGNNITNILVVLSNSNIIIQNTISSDDEYAIDLKRSSGNLVTLNYLAASGHMGDEAVKSMVENTIEENYPIPYVVRINVEFVDCFENIVTVKVQNATGRIIIEVSDRKYCLNLTDGMVSQRISGLDPGNYTLTVDYYDNRTPSHSYNETTLHVPKIDQYRFEVLEREFIEGNVSVRVELPDDSDGKVIINGAYEGERIVKLDFTEGEYDIEVNYTGSKRYADRSIQVHIVVAHNAYSSLTVSDVVSYYMTGKITAELTDYKSEPIADAVVFINVNSKTYEVKTDGSGIASIDYSLGVGSYRAIATFKGNDRYNCSSAEADIRILSRFSANKDITMNYHDGSKYTVRVLGDGIGANQIVTFNIAGKNIQVKTDKNGYASLAITSLPGKYTVTATYKGQKVKNTVRVKQNLKAGKVTVKKSAKKLVLKATLSKVKGKKLTFKFKGKTYKAKTNAKGIAKVTIKKKVLKKLKKGKKYTFTVKYYSNTVKSRVVVK